MRVRAKFINSVVLVTFVLVAWIFTRPPAEAPPMPSQPPASRAASTSRPPVEPPKRAAPEGLNERTLIGTKWERERFAIEFGADGKLLIGGRKRAQWQVEGPRIRLYHDTTGEEHWLDIVSNRLMWEGQEIGRVR